jgi:hypothetical protein
MKSNCGLESVNRSNKIYLSIQRVSHDAFGIATILILKFQNILKAFYKSIEKLLNILFGIVGEKKSCAVIESNFHKKIHFE